MSQAMCSNSTTAPDRGPPPNTTVNLNPLMMSRRGVIAALAGAAAVNVPAIAVTAVALPVASASPIHPDQALLDLGRRYDAAFAAEDAACEAWVDIGIAFRLARPAMPNVLRHRINDHYDFQFPVLGNTDRISDCDLSNYYNDAEIEYLRTMQHRTDDGRARGAQVIAAWERHRDACSELAASLGCDAAKAAYNEAVDARQGIASAIAAARATTLHGLAVRAGIVVALIGDDDEPEHLTTDEKMMQAIVRDLAQMRV